MMELDLYNQLCYEFEAAADFRKPTAESRYHKHREYIAYGLKAADLWRIMKEFRPRIMALTLEERLDLASHLLAQRIGELGHAAIYVLGKSSKALTPDHFDYLDQCLDDFRSWSHVDHFCGEVTPALLSSYRDETLAQLEVWSHSRNRFKRRTSAVAFARKVGASGAFLEECLAMCDRLIWDPEDIVQKGVGWALKEQMKVSPIEIKDYVKQLRKQGVSSTITLYAIRNLEGDERQEILAVKKGQGKV